MPSFRKSLLIGLGILLLAAGVIAYLFRGRLWSTTTVSNEPITLAILPFLSLNAAEETGFLATGLPDAIITRLANVHQIRFRRTSAIRRYERQKVSPQAAGRELAYEYVVTGTIQKVGDHLQVNVQPVRTTDEAPLWEEQRAREPF